MAKVQRHSQKLQEWMKEFVSQRRKWMEWDEMEIGDPESADKKDKSGRGETNETKAEKKRQQARKEVGAKWGRKRDRDSGIGEEKRSASM